MSKATTLGGFLAAVRTGATAGLSVRMGLLDGCQVRADEFEDRDRTVRFRISTGGLDHHRSRIAADGWNLDVFRRNPVVLWAHDHTSLPIARAVEVGAAGDELWSRAKFWGRDLNPNAERVYRLVKVGALNAASVGFVPSKYELRKAQDELPAGIDYLAQTLVEWSVVVVPSNSDALAEGRAMGESIAWIDSWCDEQLALRGLATVDRDELARLRAAAGAVPPANPEHTPPEWAGSLARRSAEFAALFNGGS